MLRRLGRRIRELRVPLQCGRISCSAGGVRDVRQPRLGLQELLPQIVQRPGGLVLLVCLSICDSDGTLSQYWLGVGTVL